MRTMMMVAVLLAACGDEPITWSVIAADYSNEGCLVTGEVMPLPVAIVQDGELVAIELANGDAFAATATSDGSFTGGSIASLGGWRLIHGAAVIDDGSMSGYMVTESARGLECYVEFVATR